jgi:serine/threonine protein kinase
MAQSDAAQRALEERLLFEALLGHPADQRRKVLASAPASPGVRAAVAELLAFHQEDEGLFGAAGLLLDLPVRTNAALVTGQRLVARYTIRSLLGTGGFGSVYLAWDELSASPVAIKLLDGLPQSQLSHYRHEAAWLRALALPGVPRALDEGEFCGCPWFAMEYVVGRPFPGAPQPMPWEELKPRAVALLDVLAAVHQAGLVHRDLKPGNILIDGQNHISLLDFGISLRPADAPGNGADPPLAAGTPPYAAPEQIDGQNVGPAADLYALGVLLLEALTNGTDPGALSLDLPRELRSVLLQLLSPDPNARPASCHAVLRAIADPGPMHPEVRWDAPRDLQALFCGAERLFHEIEDAAEALWRMSDGDRQRGAAVLDGWVRSGLASRVGERYCLRRESLDRLRLRALLADVRRSTASRPIDPARLADRLERRGFGAEALSLRMDALRATQKGTRRARRKRVRELALAALRQQRATEIDRVLRELSREENRLPGVSRWCELLRLASKANHGDGRRALAELEALGPLADSELEGWRGTLKMRAVGGSGLQQAREVHAQVSRASSQRTGNSQRARQLLWHGLLAYHAGDFAAAAHAHERSAGLLEWPQDVLRAELNAANAWLEAQEIERCLLLAARAGERAASWRLPQLEARADLLQRSALGRRGDPLEPDIEFARLVGRLGSTALEAQVLRNEAALAWRAGRAELGRNLANDGARAWASLGHPLGAALCRAVAALCGQAWEAEALAHALQQTEAASLPRVALQLAALLIDGGMEVCPRWAERFTQLTPPSHRKLRLEIFSWEELAQRLGGNSRNS